MTRLFVILLIVAVMSVPSVWAGERVVSLGSGTVTVTLVDHDSTGTLEGMSKVLITDVNKGTKFDMIIANYLVSAFADSAGGTSGGLGNIDTAIVTTKTGKDWYEMALSIDSFASLPCTLEVIYTESVPFEGDSSASGNWLFTGDGIQTGLMYDHLWFDYHLADSAGTGGTRTATIHYWIRGIELD